MATCYRIVVAGALLAAGCSRAPLPSGPAEGTILSAEGGANGYQHGFNKSLLQFGGRPKRTQQYGYIKQIGDAGTLAINLANGSVFGILRSNAPELRTRPYGSSPSDHDAFVRSYFTRAGVPAEQVSGVRTMTMAEASGKSGEKERPTPTVTAYYSVLTRAVDGIAVPDSFAWARANADGHILEEAVYWPALSQQVVLSARQLRDNLADSARRDALASRAHDGTGENYVAIRHASAWVSSGFEAFACLDVVTESRALPGDSQREQRTEREGPEQHRSPHGQIVIRHIGADGTELRLPQERRNLGGQFGARPHNHKK